MTKVELNTQVYQLLVVLRDIRPTIWRRFQVRRDITFYELHRTLQVVMGWQNYHLHQFQVGNVVLTEQRTMNEVGEVGLPVETTRLDAYVTQIGASFTYEYDFGDGWRHDLWLEQQLPDEPSTRYPRCIAGERACPPEDVGGIGGYELFLEAMADPNHSRHKHYKKWLGGDFNPEAFDAAEVNRQLREGVRWRGKLIIAPLVSSQTLTQPAQWFWHRLPPHIQAAVLGSTWCSRCGVETTMVDFQGRIQGGDLVLQGICARCGGPVGRVVEAA